MTNAPKTVCLVHNGFGGWRLWTKDDADDPTVEAVPYILAAEHERLMAERDAEIARLKAERDEAQRRRDEWRAKADGYDAVRLALREKVGAPWPPHMSRLLWAGIAADEKKRADDAASEVARLREVLRKIADADRLPTPSYGGVPGQYDYLPRSGRFGMMARAALGDDNG